MLFKKPIQSDIEIIIISFLWIKTVQLNFINRQKPVEIKKRIVFKENVFSAFEQYLSCVKEKSWNGFFPCVRSRFEVVSHQLIFSQFIDFDKEKRIKPVFFHFDKIFFILKKKFEVIIRIVVC